VTDVPSIVQKREPATDIVTFGKFRGKLEAEMLSDREYCQWLSHEPGVRALIAAAVADAVATRTTVTARPTASPTTPPPPADVDTALNVLAAHGIRFRRTPTYGSHDVALTAGKPQMLAALHRRETTR
jgi:hypothetical protein